MKRLDEILSYNKLFVEKKLYENYAATKFPDKKMIIFSCMDTRLTELLPQAMNIQNGDAKIIKNAGAIITHPFGSVMRSIIVAIYELKAEEILIIGHHGCGMSNLIPENVIDKMKDNGVTDETLSLLKFSGVDIHDWLHGFDCVYDSVRQSVSTVRNHPLVPKNIAIHGLIIDPDTGELELIVNGYEEVSQSS